MQNRRVRRTASGRSFIYNLRFPGQIYDSQAGLQQNYHRDYDPAIGRYVESDSIGLKGGVNTFASAGGSPLTNRDPFGLKIVVNGNAADYNTAISYLLQDPGMAQIIHDVRNNQSLAHDNTILNYDESLLIFNHVAAAVRFLKSLEYRIQGATKQQTASEDSSDDIPF